MNATEERARAAMRAIASTVHDAPPLQLAPAQRPDQVPDEISFTGDGRDRGGRRWRAWAAPVAAAAAAIALVLSLAVAGDLGNDSAPPGNPASPATGPDGTPRYYVALKATSDEREDLVVGDALTGKTLATFVPPARTTFQNATAAADDRTFAVFAVTTSATSFVSVDGDTLTGSWYKVSLTPGDADPVRLSRLPVKSWSWTGSDLSAPSPGQVYATALSQSGQELAVADVPRGPVAGDPNGWREVQVFSVATGRLLHDWTAADPSANLGSPMGSGPAGVPGGTPDLTWVNDDQAIEFTSFHQTGSVVTGTVRELPVTGLAHGDLLRDSMTVWSGTLSWQDEGSCYAVTAWPPLTSTDGNSAACVTFTMPYSVPGHVYFGSVPLRAGSIASGTHAVAYRAVIPPEKQTGGITTGILWLNSSASTLIVEWTSGGKPAEVHFGVASQGNFTPLRVPASLVTANLAF